MASALNAISTPYIVRQFQSLYTSSLRGQLPRHIVPVSVPLYVITARSIATPYSTSVSVPLYAITARGQLPRHIVRQFQSPCTPSPRGLSRISARQVALALASRFSRMLSFQIKDMEFTDIRWSAILKTLVHIDNVVWALVIVGNCNVDKCIIAFKIVYHTTVLRV